MDHPPLSPEDLRLLDRLRAALEPGEDMDGETFQSLALEIFAFQFERIEPFRRLCESRGARPGELTDWRQIPPVPVSAFKSLELAAAPAREIFRSSGTTRGTVRSVHHHPFPDLYRRAIERGFLTHCLRPGEDRVPLLSLIAPRHQIADSSLGFMADHLLTRFGGEPSLTAFENDGVHFAAADGWARDLGESPGLILSTAFALAWWLEDLAARRTRHPLPAGTRIFETGGFKGRTRELTRLRLVEQIEEYLSIPPSHVIREYGMSELTGHFYTDVLVGGDGDLFRVPPFMRVRALSPESLEPMPTGQPGLLAILDLANLGSAMHILTEDLGLVEEGGFRLIGRAGGAELRGCSLTVDELRP